MQRTRLSFPKIPVSKPQKVDPRIHRVITVTKALAAKSQLETAIQLWFDDADPVSIHTLAVAALDCYDALGRQAGKPSRWRELMAARSRKVQDQSTYAQNFFKHGFKDIKKQARYMPFHGEVLLFDSAICHEANFQKATPLMKAFLLRFAMSFPEFVTVDIGELIKAETGLVIDDIAPLNRSDFLKRVLPLLQKAA
jgi:hypothetical protein